MERMTEDGTTAKFVALFVVEAMSFTECEARVTEHVASYASGEFEVQTEAKAPYREIFFSDDEAESWFKIKVDFITLDERTEKQKHSKVVYLVQASSIGAAKKNVDEVMSGSMIDYKIVSLTEVAVEDVIEVSK